MKQEKDINKAGGWVAVGATDRFGQCDTETALRLIVDPKTPWGKVLEYSWSTDRWVDNYPITIWKTIWRFLCGNGWRSTENMHLLKPGDDRYDPTPYRVTHIL